MTISDRDGTPGHQGPDELNRDERWFAALTGRDSGVGDGAEAAEARRLRQVLTAPLDPQVTPSDLDRLRHQTSFRLRREGLLGARRTRIWGRPLLTRIAAAVALGIGLAALLPRLTPEPEEPVMRGGVPEQVITLRSARPMEEAARARDRIAAAGGQALIFQVDAAWHLQATLPQPLPQTLAKVLSTMAVAPPESGALHLRWLPE